MAPRPRPRSIAGFAEALSAALPARPSIMSIGTADGEVFAALAPAIPRAQAWTFVEPNMAALRNALDAAAAWADDHGWALTWPGRALLVHRPGGACRIEGMVVRPDRLALKSVREADLVVTQGILETLPPRSILGIAEAVRGPFILYAGRTGRVTFRPADAVDRPVMSLFRRAMRRDFGFGAAAGTDANALVRRTLKARGFSVATRSYDVAIKASAPSAFRLVNEIGRSAKLAPGHRGTDVDAWLKRRGRLAIGFRLSLRLGAADMIALPPRSEPTRAGKKKGR